MFVIDLAPVLFLYSPGWCPCEIKNIVQLDAPKVWGELVKADDRVEQIG